MALGRQASFVRLAENAPRRGPQSFITGMLLGDVIAWTRGSPRAAILAAFPSSVSRTYFGPYRPGSAQRIPPVINTGYGPDYADGERVRRTLVSRAALFRSSLINAGAEPVEVADAADSQAARIASQVAG